MKQSHKFAVAVVASLGLGIAAVTAYAQPGQMDGGMGPQMKGGMQHDAQGGMQHGTMGGMAHGGMGGGAQLMTPEERTALMEKMRNATPEERQKLAEATHAEMHKRAQEKGHMMRGQRGPGAGSGPSAGTAPQAPATTEQIH